MTQIKTPIQEFADKHDICDFGRELLIKRKEVTTLEQAWLAGDTLCTVFMYVKGVRTSNWRVFYEFANKIANDLYAQGFPVESTRLHLQIYHYRDAQYRLLSMQQRMNEQLLPGKRKESAELHTPQLSISIARNIALFALDYASQVRYGKFDLKFSFRMADVFRGLVGENPFEGR